MRARRRGAKVYYYYDLGGKPRKEESLGTDYALAVKKWAELEVAKVPASARPTFKDAADRYRFEVIPGKAEKTQKENLRELGKLLAFFGNPPAPLEEIEPLHIRQYLDWRKDAPVGANREKALFSHIWNKAREWGYTALANPCQGIRGKREQGRDVYIEDAIYNAVYSVADVPLQESMDLAYLIGQRPADVIARTEHDIKNGEIWLTQGKTKKKLRIVVEGELERLLTRIRARKAQYSVRSLRLIVNEEGQPLDKGALRYRFDKAREKAILAYPKLAEEIRNFQFRDLRAKAGTDKTESSGDIREAQKLLAHSSVTMTEHYVRPRKGQKVGPTK